MADFMRYLRVIGDKHNRFSQLRQESSNDQRRKVSVTDITPGQSRHQQGEGLVNAMKTVPPQFFTEEFSLTRPETWTDVSRSDSEEEGAEVLDELGGHLDVVETNLLKEIAARSDSFFEAAVYVQDLRGALHRTYHAVKDLRIQVKELNSSMLESAVTVQRLERQRANVNATCERLKAGLEGPQLAGMHCLRQSPQPTWPKPLRLSMI
ncbi:hypothetical protein WJX84_011634 [Apatococcus fuscideae]|uniref:Uncharacterized protein n=1 Tax=Apatococcus fuscideae TaxID=2026836 RepID=A0AAW1SNA1_9CHLO